MQAERTSQECGRFKRSEAEISRADFGQVTTGAQACQGKRGICPCRHDQVELAWQMVKKKSQRSMDGLLCDQMIVIQHKCNLVWQGSKSIDPGGQDGFYGWKRRESGCLKERQGGCPTARMDARESSEHIGPEACEVIIATLQRDPGGLKRSVLEPGREEGGLAKARGGCDKRKRAFHRLLESLDEV